MENTERIEKALNILRKKIGKVEVDEKDKEISLGGPVGDMWITLSESAIYTPAVKKPKIFWGITLWQDEVEPKKVEPKGRLYVSLNHHRLDVYIDYDVYKDLYETAKAIKQAKFDARLTKLSVDE